MEIADRWMWPKLKLVFFLSLFLTIFFGTMLFDVKISTGGDDSSYIEMANAFIKGRSFPTWHGPLYSIILSFAILIFGVNLIWLKLLSFVFIVGHLVIFYYSFRKIVSPSILSIIMLIVSVNSSILYFASQTYSEAMYMFLQALIVLLFLRFYLNQNTEQKQTSKQLYFHSLFLGFVVFIASLTREIGIVSLVIIILVLLKDRQFNSAGMILGSFFTFLLPYKIYKYLVWGKDISQGSRPFHEILLKNSYKPEEGYENFSAMVLRFFENSRLYLSKHLMIGLGLHNPASKDTSWLIVVLIALIFLITLYIAFRHSNVMLFVGLNIGGSIAATFIALQLFWDQMRMIIIYIPLLLLFLAWGIQQLSMIKRYRYLILILPVFFLVVFLKTLGHTVEKVKANEIVLAKNLGGDLYYGFTPDYSNFLRMSEWVGKNIPVSSLVASRKPSMSYIYSKGRDFFGMYRFPTSVPDKLIGELRKRTGELSVIQNKLVNINLSDSLKISIRKANIAFVVIGIDIFGVYKFEGESGISTLKALKHFDINPISSDSLLKKVSTSVLSCYSVSPDSLIHDLRINNVNFVMVPSLRAIEEAKTERIIDNIQRYMLFVEQKYPGIFRLVHQIGTKDEEPTKLYQVNYRFFGL